MPPTNPTPTWRLADKLVKGGMDAFITERRTAGLSWYDIALDLYLTTKGEIKVTPVSIRNWTTAEDAA